MKGNDLTVRLPHECPTTGRRVLPNNEFVHELTISSFDKKATKNFINLRGNYFSLEEMRFKLAHRPYSGIRTVPQNAIIPASLFLNAPSLGIYCGSSTVFPNGAGLRGHNGCPGLGC
jgi:hypothetical protein